METVPAEDVEPEQLPPSLSQMKDLVNGCIPPLQTKGIKYGHLNIHSLVQKIDALRILPFDVISFNETLCDFTVSDSEISLMDFASLEGIEIDMAEELLCMSLRNLRLSVGMIWNQLL